MEGVLGSNPGGTLLNGRLVHNRLGYPDSVCWRLWARRQLHAGIRFVPVASKPRISRSSMEGVLRSNPGGILLDGRLLHDRLTDFNSVCWTLLGSTPATHRYEVHRCRINTQDFAVFSGGGLNCSTAGGGCARRKLGR